MFRFSALPKRCNCVTAPVQAVLHVNPALRIKCVAMAQRHQLLHVALFAAHAQEAVLQSATGKVGVELPLDEPG